MKKNPKKNFKLVYAEVFVITIGSSPVRVGFYVENEHKEFIHVCNQKRQKIVTSDLIGYALNSATIYALLEPMKVGDDLSQVSVFVQPDGRAILHVGDSQREIYFKEKKAKIAFGFFASSL